MNNSLRGAFAVAAIGVLAFIATVFLPQPPASADVPQKISYQGFLTNSAGAPVNASLQMTFALYDVVSGGTALWFETQSVAVSNGVFNVLLGTAKPITLAFDVQYFIGITVGLPGGAEPEMSPRQPLSSAPYAIRAGCNPGDRISCYTSPTGTPGVGSCQTGTRVCNAQGTGWSACAGEVGPNCGSVCANLQTDPTHCGSCATTCPTASNATPTCSSGVCGVSCNPGTAACTGSSACINLVTSGRNCGACGTTCQDTQACVSGSCTCRAGLTACVGGCKNLQANHGSCGACGNVCATNSNCSDGVCLSGGTTCASIGRLTCNGACLTPSSLNTDNQNCGSCGNICAVDEACNAGTCKPIP